MQRTFALAAILLAGLQPAYAQDADDAPAEAEETAATETASEPDNGDGINTPKTMSGMSILGNEEAPKSLVIVPWKSSQIGDDLTLTDTLDDRAQPVDKEVFLRELEFYRIRAGD